MWVYPRSEKCTLSKHKTRANLSHFSALSRTNFHNIVYHLSNPFQTLSTRCLRCFIAVEIIISIILDQSFMINISHLTVRHHRHCCVLCHSRKTSLWYIYVYSNNATHLATIETTYVSHVAVPVEGLYYTSRFSHPLHAHAHARTPTQCTQTLFITLTFIFYYYY